MAFRYILLGLATLVLGCGHLTRPNYTSPQYSGVRPLHIGGSGEQKYAAKSGHMPRGPFQLVSPVDNFRLNRGYFLNQNKKRHRGLDLGGKRGDAIYSAHPGVVVYAGKGFRGYGKMILLEYDGTWATLYAHLDKYLVKTGDVVGAGQRIGDMGSTGRTTGVHLHFELIKDKQPIDPLPYLRMDRYLSSQ